MTRRWPLWIIVPRSRLALTIAETVRPVVAETPMSVSPFLTVYAVLAARGFAVALVCALAGAGVAFAGAVVPLRRRC